MNTTADTPRELIAALGEDAVAAALGLSVLRVRRAGFEPHLPASWYAALCDLAGRELPRAAFAFKRAAGT